MELYHYCSFDAFIKTIENGTLRFSDVTKSNDREEIILLWKKFSEFGNTYYSPIVGGLQEFEIINQINNTDFLVKCFTDKKDSLHMWNCYAKKGVCLGFDIDLLKKWIKHIGILCNTVIYDKDDEFKDIVSLGKVNYVNVKTLDEYFNELMNTHKSKGDEFEEVFKKAPFIKTDFWKEESEWRISIPIIYQSRLYTEYVEDTVKSSLFEKKVKMGFEGNERFQICRKCDVPFEPKMLVSIMVAPDCGVCLSDIRKMLIYYKFDHIIDNDKIVYSKGSIQ